MEKILDQLMDKAGYKKVPIYKCNGKKQETMFGIWYWIDYKEKTYATNIF